MRNFNESDDMKKFIVLTCFGLAIAISAPVVAGPQQEKMKGCNQEAKDGGLKGDERKAFMSKCLKKDYVLKSAADQSRAETAPETAKVKQQDKMKSCNAEAKARELQGDERKQFMSSSLKG